MSSNQEAMSWKVEPLSPSGTPPLDTTNDIDEEWLCFDEKSFELESTNTELYTDGLTRAQVATKYLEELELKKWIKEESFADWLEEKIDLPIFEELPVPECGQNRAIVYTSVKQQHQHQHPHHAHQHQQQHQQHSHHAHHQHQQQQHHAEDPTQTLLREFETVLGDVQACHQVVVGPSVVSTLTPPQSPPPPPQQIIARTTTTTTPSASRTTIGKQQHHHHAQHQQQQQQQQHEQPNAHLLVSLQPIHHLDQSSSAFVYGQLQQHEIAVTSLHGHHHPEQFIVPTVSEADILDHRHQHHSHAQQQQQHQHQHQEQHHQQQQQQQQHHHQIAEQWNAENLSLDPLVHGGDYAHELAKVDEYVRSCAEDAACGAAATASSSSSSSDLSASSSSAASSSSSPPSPCTSSNASCMSSEDSADDPDWPFEGGSSSSSGGGGGLSSYGRRNGGDVSASTATHQSSRGSQARRAAKPYSRPTVEDKRVRKKEQNKNAATRYRQKKKQEIKKILGEEQELVDRNDKLQAKVTDLQREIGYLKGLMRDLFRAKGLIK